MEFAAGANAALDSRPRGNDKEWLHLIYVLICSQQIFTSHKKERKIDLKTFWSSRHDHHAR
jgi:hypothetical protein